MNKRGQALVTFVLFLPLIVLFIGYYINVVESLLVKNQIDGIVYDNLKIALENNFQDEDIIRDVILENDDHLNVDVTVDNDMIQIEVNARKKNLFNIFNKEKYDLQVKYCASYLDKKITKNCG